MDVQRTKGLHERHSRSKTQKLGEVVWAIRPKSKGVNKWDYRWYEGYG